MNQFLYTTLNKFQDAVPTPTPKPIGLPTPTPTPSPQEILNKSVENLIYTAPSEVPTATFHLLGFVGNAIITLAPYLLFFVVGIIIIWLLHKRG